MAIFYNFYRKAAMQMASLLHIPVAPEDLEFGAPTSTPSGSTYTVQAKVTHTATGQSRTLQWDRTALDALIEAGIPLALKTIYIGNCTKVSEIVPLINDRLGLPCKTLDFVEGSLPADGALTLTAAATSHAYSGSCVIGITRVPTSTLIPDWEWGVNGSLKNYGRIYNSDLAPAQFRSIDVDGVTYVGSAVSAWGALPTALPANTNYTLDIVLIAEPFASTTQFGAIFNNQATHAAVGNGGLLTYPEAQLVNRGNCYYLNNVAYSALSDVATHQFSRKPRRLTIVRNGTSFKFYEDGELVWSTTSSTATVAWTYFGPNSDRLLCFKNCRFFRRALSDTELKQLFEFDQVPEYRFALNGVNTNTGRLGGNTTFKLGPKFDYRQVAGKTMAYLQSYGVQTLDPRLALKVSGEFTLGFTVALDKAYAEARLFSTNPAVDGARGSIAFINNRFVQLGVTPDAKRSAIPAVPVNTPTKVLLRSKGGTHELWINDTLATSYPVTDSGDLYLKSFRDSGAFLSQWMENSSISDLQYWSYAISERGRKLLQRKANQLAEPLHWWPLDTDNRNLGLDTRVWAPAMTYGTVGTKPMAAFAGTLGQALGVNLSIAGDYTLEFTHAFPTEAWTKTEGLLGFNHYMSHNGLLQFTTAGLQIIGCATVATLPAALKDGKPHRWVIRQRSGKVSVWVETTQLVNEVAATVPNVSNSFFGGGGGNALSTARWFADFKYWDFALTDAEVTTLINTALR